MKNRVLYILSTDYGDWLLDDNLEFCLEDDRDLEPEIVVRVMDTALATSEHWEHWYANNTDKEILDKIRPVLKKKIMLLLGKALEH